MDRAHHRCPRCGGNLFPNDSDGPGIWSCLQCARSFNLAQQAAIKHPERDPAPRAA